jgi:hypothetical protein
MSAKQCGATNRRCDEKVFKSAVALGEMCVGARACLTLNCQMREKLQGAIQLPMCLRVVGLLKRLGAHSDVELRVTFLHARHVWLRAALRGIPRDSAYGERMCVYV